jgi:hypothetical protein
MKVKERPFAEGTSLPDDMEQVIASFINLQKLWYLLALSNHFPHHRHLEWLKLMREQL